MFAHIPAYAGDPILSLNEDFQKDPRPHKVNLSIGIYFDDAGPHPGARLRARRRGADARRGGPKPYLPIEGSAAARGAVQELLFGADHPAVPAAASPRCRPSAPAAGSRSAPTSQALVPGQPGVGQRPDLGQPPGDVRGRRAAVNTYPYYDAATGGAALRRACCERCERPPAQRGAAARLLPQPDRRRPEPRAVAAS
jgi:aromatic-amino-acid transaminase